MSKTVRVTLTGDYDHGVHGEQRVFRAGAHSLPLSIARAAHAAGVVDGPAPTEDDASVAETSQKPARVRKPKVATIAVQRPAKPFPAAKPAKKPAAKAKA